MLEYYVDVGLVVGGSLQHHGGVVVFLILIPSVFVFVESMRWLAERDRGHGQTLCLPAKRKISR
jgi:hypothetical protein